MPTGDEEFGELVGPRSEDGADVVEDVAIGSGDGDGDDGAPSAELGVVEKRSPESQEALEDLRSALATGRLHRPKSPLAGPVECSVEQLGLPTREVVVHRSPGCVGDGQDLLEGRALDSLGWPSSLTAPSTMLERTFSRGFTRSPRTTETADRAFLDIETMQIDIVLATLCMSSYIEERTTHAHDRRVRIRRAPSPILTRWPLTSPEP